MVTGDAPRLHDFVSGAASAVLGVRLGLVEAAAVEQLVEERQGSEGEHGQDEEQEDDEAGHVPAVMEREDRLHRSSAATGHAHGDLHGEGKTKKSVT